MATERKTPGVFLERLTDEITATTGMTGTVAGFLGITERGLLGTAQKVTSWSDYTNKYAYGLNSPFYANSDLAYSVYGFFQNGGKECYIGRVAHSTAAKATMTIGTTNTVTVTALEEGAFANSLSVTVSANALDATLFDVVVTSTLKGSSIAVEKYRGVSNTTTHERYYASIINGASKYIQVSLAGTLVVKPATALSGGVDGISDIADTDYTTALSQFDMFEDLSFLSIPGQTSVSIQSALKTYAEANLVTVVFDASPTASVTDIVDLRESTLTSCDFGALYYPTFKVVDPLSASGALRTVPNSGHIIGVMARIIGNKGIGSTPAGTDAVIKGAVELVSVVNYADRDTLFDNKVNVILSKTNYGIVPWGKQTLSNDKDFNTVAKITLYNYIYKMMEAKSQFAVFETNGEILWNKLFTMAQEFLNDIWVAGGIYGTTAEEAYSVKCDAEINDVEAQKSGDCYLLFRYLPNPTADYVTIKIGQKTLS